MRPLRFAALCALLITAMRSAGQGIDSVIVERYCVVDTGFPSAGPAAAGDGRLVTYRIFIDLAPGYTLQMVYGDERHRLRISTTTAFFNDLRNGVKYADRLEADQLNTFPLAMDSWLTLGPASNGHWGVPKDLDPDGSVIECPPYPARPPDPRDMDPEGAALDLQDGLITADTLKEIVTFRLDPGYLGKVRGSMIETTDGAWAVLGGVRGITERNIVLIAQITTTGELEFLLNLQLGTPDHRAEKYVPHDPGPGEVLCPALARGRYVEHP